MKEKLKNEKAITLIALIITVIIMLILAGVSISIIKNQGIITKSNEAVEKYSQADKDEQENLTEMEKMIDEYSNNKWWKMTETEKTQITFGSEGIALIAYNDGSVLGEGTVLLTDNMVMIIRGNAEIEDEIDVYAYCFGEGEVTLGSMAIRLEKNKTWYCIATDGSNELSKEEYNGASPIKKEDFAEGEIISETYLQRVINSF